MVRKISGATYILSKTRISIKLTGTPGEED